MKSCFDCVYLKDSYECTNEDYRNGGTVDYPALWICDFFKESEIEHLSPLRGRREW